jgi:hypothetical protein
MRLDLTGKSWANKTIPNFTDAEIIDAIETYESAGPNGNPDVYRGIIREWERRHGLAEKAY